MADLSILITALMTSIKISVLPLPVTPCNKFDLNFLVLREDFILSITLS